MQKFVQELKQILPFKGTTQIGDIVLVAAKTPQILMFAHVDDIVRDATRKDEWWHLHMTVLSIPLQKLTWTLRIPQMTGAEIFTMGGEERFVQAVDFQHTSLEQASILLNDAPKKNKSRHLKRIK